MKTFFCVIGCIMLMLGTALPLLAEENGSADIQSELALSDAYANMANNFIGIEFLVSNADPEYQSADPGYKEFSTGRRIGAGFLNLFLGVGSYTMGDWKGGLLLTLYDVITVPLLVIGIALLVQNEGWFELVEYKSLGDPALDIVLLWPVWYGFYFVFWALPYIGMGLYGVNVVAKFIQPFSYNGPEQKTARVDDPRNWSIALAPDMKGGVTGIVAFTAHF